MFLFIDEFDIVTNLNNYKDIQHYSNKVNSIILVKMKNGESLLTNDNFEIKMNEIKTFYTTYDYEKLFYK